MYSRGYQLFSYFSVLRLVFLELTLIECKSMQSLARRVGTKIYKRILRDAEEPSSNPHWDECHDPTGV
jgi:hypothetical protein